MQPTELLWSTLLDWMVDGQISSWLLDWITGWQEWSGWQKTCTIVQKDVSNLTSVAPAILAAGRMINHEIVIDCECRSLIFFSQINMSQSHWFSTFGLTFWCFFGNGLNAPQVSRDRSWCFCTCQESVWSKEKRGDCMGVTRWLPANMPMFACSAAFRTVGRINLVT